MNLVRTVLVVLFLANIGLFIWAQGAQGPRMSPDDIDRDVLPTEPPKLSLGTTRPSMAELKRYGQMQASIEMLKSDAKRCLDGWQDSARVTKVAGWLAGVNFIALVFVIAIVEGLWRRREDSSPADPQAPAPPGA